MRYFSLGETILRREVLHGKPWSVMPVRVVHDDAKSLVVYLMNGAELGFPSHALTHDWHAKGRTHWRGPGRLEIRRPQDAYSVNAYWNLDGQFEGWYIDLQDPYRRTEFGFDTLDHALDYWVPVDGLWSERDRDELEAFAAAGKYSPRQVSVIKRQGEQIVTMLETEDYWWDLSWADWAPDPGWQTPVLPDGWADYPIPRFDPREHPTPTVSL